ncbi:ATP-dependent Clp protease proteolytic subunit [Streptomyces sp. NPDC056500]|uniref:ATP-dependent Clp protease proteolytic subunit n=1 Tax=Streptomyces sp. NPDC056500 TaxID=3345840 RepID=UPI003679B507
MESHRTSPNARYVLPEFTERSSTGTRTLDPYAKLLEERIVFLGNHVDDTAANDVIVQFLHLEHADPDRHISLYINSPGGSYSAMTAIYDTIQSVICEVETVCLGQAVSTAALLLASGTPGRRMALPGARLVLKQPSSEGEQHGQLSDLDIQAKELLRQRKQFTALMARHTGREPARVAEDLERDAFFSATAAQEYGFVDHVIMNRGATPSGPGSR